ncbi:MAG TPA: hypothetical protein VEU29_02405 [Actinomycetota bacterium]|nr:hypothetical protein [Actinomycetota bacterium]
MQSYWELDGFESLYLEDSFLLDVVARPGSLVIEVELVLKEDHPAFRSPQPGERYCYRRGRISFEEVKHLTWLASGFMPARDATGTVDWGGFDEFGRDGSTFVFAADFGRVELEASACRVDIDP